MSDNQQHLLPERVVKPAAAIFSGAFLLSPLGIPFFVRGIPRILLAGIGGFLAGNVVNKVACTLVENLGEVMRQKEEERVNQELSICDER